MRRSKCEQLLEVFPQRDSAQEEDHRMESAYYWEWVILLYCGVWGGGVADIMQL